MLPGSQASALNSGKKRRLSGASASSPSKRMTIDETVLDEEIPDKMESPVGKPTRPRVKLNRRASGSVYKQVLERAAAQNSQPAPDQSSAAESSLETSAIPSSLDSPAASAAAAVKRPKLRSKRTSGSDYKKYLKNADPASQLPSSGPSLPKADESLLAESSLDKTAIPTSLDSPAAAAPAPATALKRLGLNSKRASGSAYKELLGNLSSKPPNPAEGVSQSNPSADSKQSSNKSEAAAHSQPEGESSFSDSFIPSTLEAASTDHQRPRSLSKTRISQSSVSKDASEDDRQPDGEDVEETNSNDPQPILQDRNLSAAAASSSSSVVEMASVAVQLSPPDVMLAVEDGASFSSDKLDELNPLAGVEVSVTPPIVNQSNVSVERISAERRRTDREGEESTDVQPTPTLTRPSLAVSVSRPSPLAASRMSNRSSTAPSAASVQVGQMSPSGQISSIADTSADSEIPSQLDSTVDDVFHPVRPSVPAASQRKSTSSGYQAILSQFAKKDAGPAMGKPTDVAVAVGHRLPIDKSAVELSASNLAAADSRKSTANLRPSMAVPASKQTSPPEEDSSRRSAQVPVSPSEASLQKAASSRRSSKLPAETSSRSTRGGLPSAIVTSAVQETSLVGKNQSVPAKTADEAAAAAASAAIDELTSEDENLPVALESDSSDAESLASRVKSTGSAATSVLDESSQSSTAGSSRAGRSKKSLNFDEHFPSKQVAAALDKRGTIVAPAVDRISSPEDDFHSPPETMQVSSTVVRFCYKY